MRRPVFAKNARVGYTFALIFFFTACALFAAGWISLGSGMGAAAIILAIDTASAHGHLSKRKNDHTNSI